MGTVAEVLRKRERREPRRRVSLRTLLWDLLWTAAIVPTFVYGGSSIIPDGTSRWLAALQWAGYGALFSVAVFALLLAAAPLRKGRSVWRPLRVVVFVTLYVTCLALIPQDWGSPPGLLRVMAAAMIAAIATARIDTAVQRRAAARRELEAARLAEEVF